MVAGHNYTYYHVVVLTKTEYYLFLSDCYSGYVVRSILHHLPLLCPYLARWGNNHVWGEWVFVFEVGFVDRVLCLGSHPYLSLYWLSPCPCPYPYPYPYLCMCHYLLLQESDGEVWVNWPDYRC